MKGDFAPTWLHTCKLILDFRAITTRDWFAPSQATNGAFAAILADGSVVTWGKPMSGGDSSEVQDQLKGVQQLQATRYAFAAILADGSVVTWGCPAHGGDSSQVQHQLKGVQQVQATKSSYSFSAFAAILADGSVVTWGDPANGGDSSVVQDQLKGVQQVQATSFAFAAILADGSVVTWGDPANGGDSSVVQDQLKGVQQVQATSFAFAAILADGSVVTWGEPDSGGDSSEVQDQLKGVQQLQATRYAFAAILADGSVVTWGHPEFGGDSSEVQDQLKGVQQLQATDQAFAAILADGSVVTWGDPEFGGDLGLQSCHHQILGGPKSRLTHQPGSQQMHSVLLEAAGHLWVDLGLQSCHHQILDRPKSRLTHQPGSQQMPGQLLEAAAHLWADLGLQSCHHPVWIAPCDNSVTSRAKQGKRSSCCCQLCLQDNSRQMVSILESRSLQRHCRIQRVMVCSHKPQEATLKGFLCQNPQVPYFGGLRNRKLLTVTAWQSYSDLKHVSRSSNRTYGPVSTIDWSWANNRTTFRALEQTPKTNSAIQTPCWNDWNCLSKGHDKQSLMNSCWTLPVSQVVWVISGILPVIIPALKLVRTPLTWICIERIVFVPITIPIGSMYGIYANIGVYWW